MNKDKGTFGDDAGCVSDGMIPCVCLVNSVCLGENEGVHFPHYYLEQKMVGFDKKATVVCDKTQSMCFL